MEKEYGDEEGYDEEEEEGKENDYWKIWGSINTNQYSIQSFLVSFSAGCCENC